MLLLNVFLIEYAKATKERRKTTIMFKNISNSKKTKSTLRELTDADLMNVSGGDRFQERAITNIFGPNGEVFTSRDTNNFVRDANGVTTLESINPVGASISFGGRCRGCRSGARLYDQGS